MDDLMNRVGALIEEHVKSEVEARAAFTRPSKDEIRRGARALGFWEKLCEMLSDGPNEDESFDDVMAKIQALRVERDEAKRAEMNFTAQFDIMRKERGEAQAMVERLRNACSTAYRTQNHAEAERDKYRTMWEQLHRAQSEDLDAQEQLKELLSTIGLAHFDRSVIAGALELTRKRDARLVSERDEALALAKDRLGTIAAEKARADANFDAWDKACVKVRELEAKLLEVRKAVSEKAPAESAKAPTKPSELQIGDLVARHARGPGCWGVVQAVDGDRVQVSYPTVGEGLYWHYERELTRKPIEKGDRVRCVSGTFKERSGTVEQMNNIQCCVTRNSGAFWTETSTLVAIVAP